MKTLCLLVFIRVHQSVYLVTRVERTEASGGAGKERKGVQRPQSSQEHGERCGARSLFELLKNDL